MARKCGGSSDGAPYDGWCKVCALAQTRRLLQCYFFAPNLISNKLNNYLPARGNAYGAQRDQTSLIYSSLNSCCSHALLRKTHTHAWVPRFLLMYMCPMTPVRGVHAWDLWHQWCLCRSRRSSRDIEWCSRGLSLEDETATLAKIGASPCWDYYTFSHGIRIFVHIGYI